tara:strand:- start:2290 stop:3174 length:885 start_codon:yes stop_codon:yes gene_type:complete
MGLYTGNIGDYYAGLETEGVYQFTSIKDIITNFRVAYVGEDKVISKISRADIRFHALRGLQELSYDTLKSIKDLELEVPSKLVFPLPHDYVNYVKITWTDSSGIEHVIYPARKTSDPISLEQNDDGGVAIVNNGIVNLPPTPEPSTTWDNFSSDIGSNQTDYNEEYDMYSANNGQRYGLDPQYAQDNGSFFINHVTGFIHFSSNISGKTVTLKYISDGVGSDLEMVVHKFAEEALYKHIAHAILNTRANVDRNIVAAYKKERFAAIRNAKIRLSNIKLEEITQVLRGKSKWIKH